MVSQHLLDFRTQHLVNIVLEQSLNPMLPSSITRSIENGKRCPEDFGEVVALLDMSFGLLSTLSISTPLYLYRSSHLFRGQNGSVLVHVRTEDSSRLS